MYALEMIVFLINLLIFGAVFVVWLAEYILQGMGLYKIAQSQEIDTPWMAFVPWLRTYLHGKIAGTISLGKKEIKNPGLWMVLVPIVLGGVIGVTYFAMFMVMIVGAIGTTGAAGESVYTGGVFMMIFFFIVFVIIMIAVIAYAAFMGVLRGMVNYRIFKRFNSESKAVLHTLLSLFVPMYQAIYFFMLRRRVHVKPKSQPPYRMPQSPYQGAPQGQQPQCSESQTEIQLQASQMPSQEMQEQKIPEVYQDETKSE